VSPRLYTDHHVRAIVTKGLRRRGVDIITCLDDKSERLADTNLLDRSSALGRMLFTQDEDLLTIATHRIAAGQFFSGVVYVIQQRLTDRQIIDDLELLAKASEAEEWANQILYLPI
jgi:hypothetical protein